MALPRQHGHKRRADSFVDSLLGRISRSRFWLSMSVLGGSWVTMDMVLACGDSDTKALRAPLELMFLIACLMLHVKRCHDRDRSGWFVLVALVPPFTLWYLIETLCLRGTQGSNRFGRDPLSSQRARVKRRKGLRQQSLRAEWHCFKHPAALDGHFFVPGRVVSSKGDAVWAVV
jgi:uncharacterized membrane protein YhaH (DUF805 family)